jgi:hypothetical protein
MLPEKVDYRKKNIPNITKAAMKKVRGSGIGYYTFRFNHLFGTGTNVFFCRLEALRRDLWRFFESIGEANDQLREYVLEAEKKNISEHRHYSYYYTPELQNFVTLRDGELIERFGYVFERARFLDSNQPEMGAVRGEASHRSDE